MRIAIADLGTNTFNLLIRDSESGEVIYNNKIPVKLGSKGITSGKIAPDAFERGLEAMISHKSTASDYHANVILAFATSAVRSASNGQEFVDAVFEATQIKVEIIGGMREAELIFKGVQQAVDIGEEPVLIMDIGGGSTEFILGNKHEVFWANSYELGVTRLLDYFSPNNPIKPAEAMAVRQHVESMLGDLLHAYKEHPARMLIGSSGSFDTLYDVLALRHNRAPLQLGQISGSFDEGELRILINDLIGATTEERLQMPGMLEMRAEMIHLAGIQIALVLDLLSIDKIRLSTYSLKEGVYAERLKK
ncbi:MAG: phosphatase [Flavobacteriia bacterium]|nr:phosphatase [Flavobacteriia bacterium]